MITREEFDELHDQLTAYDLRLREKDRYERGGTTLGELLDSGDLAEAFVETLQNPDYIRRSVHRMLERQMAEPEDPSCGGNLGNRYCVGINDLDNEYYPEDPAVLGAFAARHYKMRMAQNRLRSLRDFAALCGSLADTFEGRLSAESQIRRIQ